MRGHKICCCAKRKLNKDLLSNTPLILTTGAIYLNYYGSCSYPFFSIFILAISTAIRINETVVIITVAVTLAAIGTFCSIRCVRRRTRQQRPVQVPAVSSTSEEAAADPPVSPRRRRLYQGSSFESIELFNVAKED